MQYIISRQNAHFKQARKLAASARERNKAGQILIDGTRLVRTYSNQFGLAQSALLLSEQGASRPDVQQMLKSAAPCDAYVLAEELFAEITQVETPEGIVALVPMPRVESKNPDDFQVLVDGVQDPGNLGGLLRTAAAAGATTAYLAKGCADPWSPKSLRGGMGAQFSLPLRERANLAAVLEKFQGTVIATSPYAERTIFDMDLRGPVAMIFGTEGTGVADNLLAAADCLVKVPMAGGPLESLNVAAAAAVCCFEKLRQKYSSIG